MMFTPRFILYFPLALTHLTVVAFPQPSSSPAAEADAISTNVGAFVPFRIEGEHGTIFEDRIFTRGKIVTTASGGTHRCDGTNNREHLFPGPTATSALDDAARKNGFTFDGTFDPEFDDFFITSIADSPQTDTQFWGLLIDFFFSPVGGCQLRATESTHILWAFDAFNVDAFLFLRGPQTARLGKTVVLTVTNGTRGGPIPGASIGDGFGTTDARGRVSVKLAERGKTTFKASKAGTVRSNALEILVA